MMKRISCGPPHTTRDCLCDITVAAGVSLLLPLPHPPTLRRTGATLGLPIRGLGVFSVIWISALITMHKNHLGILVNDQVLKVGDGSHVKVTRPHGAVRP